MKDKINKWRDGGLMPVEFVEKILDYNPNTGKFFWKERTSELFIAGRTLNSWNSRRAYKETCLTIHEKGCLYTRILNRHYKAHRLAWAIMMGEWPDQIDHINGDSKDNRFVNLRNVTNAENKKNLGISITNKSGILGVCWSKRDKRWLAVIQVSRKSICLGRFRDIEPAIAARKAGEIKYGFHPNHGKRWSYNNDRAA